jgi:hypothetical protein
MTATLHEVRRLLQDAALTLRGGFHPTDDDGVPEAAPGTPTKTVVLAGNVGEGMWKRFDADRRITPMTLDEWSQCQLHPVAAALGARAVFPFERPYLPFQRWAMRAEPCRPSPLGILIHPDYGLWHGYRGALLFPHALSLPAPDIRPSPCDACVGRPCLAACPVNAFDGAGYDVPACAAHLRDHPDGDCMSSACRARRACPVGTRYRYRAEQARFHMEAFRRNHLA